MIVLPLLGAVLWFIFGRPYNKPTAKPVRRQPTAPDDDPEFLRNLETRRRNQAEDDRLKKLKADLEAKERALGEKPADGSDVTPKITDSNPATPSAPSQIPMTRTS